MRARRAARAARASAARAAFVRRRLTAIPATTSSCTVRGAGGRVEGSSPASARSASSRRPIRRRRRTARFRACAAFTRSPWASSVARAASSAFAGQPRARAASAISASATTHRARATASLGPNARAARRTRALARTRSPSCAMATPRRARAGGSARRATRFSAPRGSPPASARAAALISESIEIPSQLSLPGARDPGLDLSHEPRRTAGARATRRDRTMTKHRTGTRDQWRTERLELLEAEKELTRRSDELARRRQDLPWVRVDNPYRFETEEGGAALPDLFRGRSQLLVYHFMFGPDYSAGCPSCSAIADGFNGFAVHLANHDVMLWAVSRAPLAKPQADRPRRGWTFRLAAPL